MYEPYKWTFDSPEVTEVFDMHVQQSVPFYAVFHDMIKTFAQYYIEPKTMVYDLGCSTGKLLVDIANSNNKEGVCYQGVDTSESMIIEALNRGRGMLNVDFTCEDVRDVYLINTSFVYSMLCLQFIPLADRQRVIKQVYEGLQQNGAFVMVEKVKSSNIDIHDIYNDIYYDFKRLSGLSDKEILDKNVSLRGVMKPATLEENIKMLEQAGFSHIEVFIKYNNFAGIIAIK